MTDKPKVEPTPPLFNWRIGEIIASALVDVQAGPGPAMLEWPASKKIVIAVKTIAEIEWLEQNLEQHFRALFEAKYPGVTYPQGMYKPSRMIAGMTHAQRLESLKSRIVIFTRGYLTGFSMPDVGVLVIAARTGSQFKVSAMRIGPYNAFHVLDLAPDRMMPALTRHYSGMMFRTFRPGDLNSTAKLHRSF